MKISVSIILLVIIPGFLFIQGSPVSQSGQKSGSMYPAELVLNETFPYR
ncbi:MAG: hypothetical protein WAW07_08005 [Bacteroidales bacterium]